MPSHISLRYRSPAVRISIGMHSYPYLTGKGPRKTATKRLHAMCRHAVTIGQCIVFSGRPLMPSRSAHLLVAAAVQIA